MDIDSRVKKVLSKALIVDDRLILDSALLVEDLGVSSLDRFELLMGLVEEFGIEIHEQDLEGVKTVADVVRYIDRKTKPQAASPS
jgi:acyl carrier protein